MTHEKEAKIAMSTVPPGRQPAAMQRSGTSIAMLFKMPRAGRAQTSPGFLPEGSASPWQLPNRGEWPF
jgi:hypothetical protein